MRKQSRFSLSTTQVILISFLIVILVGSGLLMLPISIADGQSVKYIDALFTATSATCVTGLLTVPAITTWTGFGQAIILLLIQIGGLGVITVVSAIMIFINKKIGIKDSHLIQDAFNLNTLGGLATFVKKVIKGVFIVELIGAVLYSFVFVPDFGARGIWVSIFNSVSAFCNAGIDIVGMVSLVDYATNPLVNIVTCSLIVLGGLGYIVWWDFIRVIKRFGKEKFKCFAKLTLHSKIVLTTTFILIVFGAVLIFIFEYNNPYTFGDMNIFEKIQASIFQSITTRTAGFATVYQENMTNASALISIVLMFIGGSPVGTAGGIKTATIAVLFSSFISIIKNRNETLCFGRNIPIEVVKKAIAVTFTTFMIVFVSTVCLSIASNAGFLDVLYETVSATGTVGLSRNMTTSLNLAGKIIIIITMFLGRVTPMSFALLLRGKTEQVNVIKHPNEDVTVG